jgi:hypothetical protein
VTASSTFHSESTIAPVPAWMNAHPTALRLDQKPFGMKSLVLANGVQDPAMLKQRLGLRLAVRADRRARLQGRRQRSVHHPLSHERHALVVDIRQVRVSVAEVPPD